jgi:hypothetical protein
MDPTLPGFESVLGLNPDRETSLVLKGMWIFLWVRGLCTEGYVDILVGMWFIILAPFFIMMVILRTQTTNYEEEVGSGTYHGEEEEVGSGTCHGEEEERKGIMKLTMMMEETQREFNTLVEVCDKA